MNNTKQKQQVKSSHECTSNCRRNGCPNCVHGYDNEHTCPDCDEDEGFNLCENCTIPIANDVQFCSRCEKLDEDYQDWEKELECKKDSLCVGGSKGMCRECSNRKLIEEYPQLKYLINKLLKEEFERGKKTKGIIAIPKDSAVKFVEQVQEETRNKVLDEIKEEISILFKHEGQKCVVCKKREPGIIMMREIIYRLKYSKDGIK